MASGIRFGSIAIPSSQLFYKSPSGLTIGLVNLKPIVPGRKQQASYFVCYYPPFPMSLPVRLLKSDVLLLPARVVPRFYDMKDEEVTDLWLSVKRISKAIESHYAGTSLTTCIQDGPQAGQTIPHVHVHIIPRKDGDFDPNDKVYDAVDESERKYFGCDDDERKPRSTEEMAAESMELRKLVGWNE